MAKAQLILCLKKKKIRVDHRYAFEFKRWQTDKEALSILSKDHTNLVGFIDASPSTCSGYELILSVNANEDIKKPKDEWFDGWFKDVLSGKYSKLQQKVLDFDSFKVCIYLAAPITQAREANA